MIIDFEKLIMPYEYESRQSLKSINLIRSMSHKEFDYIKKGGKFILQCVDKWKSEEIFNSRFPTIVKIAFIKCFSTSTNQTIQYWKEHRPNEIIVKFNHFGIDWIDFDKGVRVYDENGILLNTIAFEKKSKPFFSTGTFSSCTFTTILKRVVYEKIEHGAGIERDNSKLNVDNETYTDFFSAFFNVKNNYKDQNEVRLLICLRATHKIDLPQISKVVFHLKKNYLKNVIIDNKIDKK